MGYNVSKSRLKRRNLQAPEFVVALWDAAWKSIVYTYQRQAKSIGAWKINSVYVHDSERKIDSKSIRHQNRHWTHSSRSRRSLRQHRKSRVGRVEVFVCRNAVDLWKKLRTRKNRLHVRTLYIEVYFCVRAREHTYVNITDWCYFSHV